MRLTWHGKDLLLYYFQLFHFGMKIWWKSETSLPMRALAHINVTWREHITNVFAVLILLIFLPSKNRRSDKKVNQMLERRNASRVSPTSTFCWLFVFVDRFIFIFLSCFSLPRNCILFYVDEVLWVRVKIEKKNFTCMRCKETSSTSASSISQKISRVHIDDWTRDKKKGNGCARVFAHQKKYIRNGNLKQKKNKETTAEKKWKRRKKNFMKIWLMATSGDAVDVVC